MSRIGGVFYLRVGGKLYQAGDGAFTFSIGGVKREAKMSSSGVAGFLAKPVVPYLEGDLILRDLDLEELVNAEDVTVTLELYNGKSFVLHEAYYVGESEATTEGTIKIRFEGKRGELLNG